ncbi:MAG: methylisocitrate lyase [Bdellovibrionota bacterium]
MLFTKKNASEKRAAFHHSLNSGKLLRFPGSFSPYIALMIQEIGFDGVYVSGAGLANDLGLPDIGLTTLSEVSQRAYQIARVTDLPTLVDIDTGFGEPMSAARTVREFEDLGIAGCHIEDQINPKRCGHLDGKGIVAIEDMVKKIRAASNAKRDSNFVLMARTDAAASEGLEAAIERAKAYVDAGADAIFPEAMRDEKDFAAFRKAIKVPLLANMTEFGKSRLLSRQELENLGMNIVIYPMTHFRLAMGAVEAGYQDIFEKGTQEQLLDKMQTRKRLYEFLRYEDYNAFDQAVFNFSQKNHGGK